MNNLLDFFEKNEKQRRIKIYDEAWKTAFDSVRKDVASGNDLLNVVENILEENSKYNGFIPNHLLNQVHAIDYGCRFGRVPRPYRLAVLDGTYVSVPRELPNTRMLDAITSRIDSDVDCLVEFGSGLGINLARIRLRLPDANLCYVACEPSENGRLATESLFSLDPTVQLKTQYFDYLAPDMGILKKFKKIIAFTCHSIEQIMILGNKFYDELLSTNLHACIHCEPIGWQRSAECCAIARDLVRNDELRRHYEKSYTFVLDNKNMLVNASVWAGLGGYNMDLSEQILNAVEKGEVNITGTDYDFVGSNPFNPSTLISWERN